MKPLRIAMLGHKRIPSREGGVEIVVSELAVRMAEKGHRVVCYNRRGHHVSGADFDVEKQKEWKGVRLKNVLTFDKKGLAALTASFSAAFLSAFSRCDIVHFHAEGPCAMMWLPKLFGKRCIATIHGLDHQRAKWGRFASWYILSGERCAVKYADEIIVLSENVQKYFLETYNRKTLFIPNGATRPEPCEAKEIVEKWGLEKDSYILFLGRLVPEKAPDLLVRAYKELSLSKKLVIAGGASDTSDYARELQEAAEGCDGIIFTGFVQGRVLEELYSNAYIYSLPSNLEGMPLSLLEAMSYGACALTSDIPECASVVGDCGVTFKKGDAEDLKNKLEYLCSSPKAVSEIKSRAAEQVLSRYNWDEVVEKTLDVYGA